MFDSAYDFRGLPKAESDPVVTENPQKHQKYEVTVTFKDAPGGFEIAELVENYAADNCIYTTNRMAGATALAHYQPKFSLQKISDTVYRGEFYTDRPLNEDYYDQGVCLWNFFALSLGFQANGDKKSTYFKESIDDTVWKNMTEKGAITKLVYYHGKDEYPSLENWQHETGYLSLGMTPKEVEDKKFNSNELFSVELEIRRI